VPDDVDDVGKNMGEKKNIKNDKNIYDQISKNTIILFLKLDCLG